jgi:hypothetical protein
MLCGPPVSGGLFILRKFTGIQPQQAEIACDKVDTFCEQNEPCVLAYFATKMAARQRRPHRNAQEIAGEFPSCLLEYNIPDFLMCSAGAAL